MKRVLLGLLFLTVAPASLFAHAGHDHGATGFSAGWMHPFGGWDHILAMVAVGLWAAQLGRKALAWLPAGFGIGMLAGGALSLAQVTLPGVEAGILASVLVLGALLAMAVRLSILPAAAMVAIFAVFHGYAHLTEMSGNSVVQYAGGFLLGSAVLIAAGAAAGLACKSLKLPVLPRVAGAAACITGVMLAVM